MAALRSEFARTETLAARNSVTQKALAEAQTIERRYNEAAPAQMLAFLERSGAHIGLT